MTMFIRSLICKQVLIENQQSHEPLEGQTVGSKTPFSCLVGWWVVWLVWLVWLIFPILGSLRGGAPHKPPGGGGSGREALPPPVRSHTILLHIFFLPPIPFAPLKGDPNHPGKFRDNEANVPKKTRTSFKPFAISSHPDTPTSIFYLKVS